MALSDWKSMYAVSVTAGSGAGANYQHNLYLNYGAGGNTGAYLYFNGQCKTDFTDVRVLSGDGLFLPHTLKNVTAGVSATLVFKDTADCDVAHTVYVLFNNPSATDVSDDAAVFIDSISGVVGAWLMNEPLAADAVVDYSGNGNDGTPTGTTIVDGKYVGTKARSFNGLGNDFITIAHNVALNTDYDFSIVIDFKLAQALFGYQMLIVKGNVNGMYSAYVWTNDYLLFRVNSGTKYFSTFTTFGTDWAQLTITRDGDVNGAIAYKNNVAMTERDDILLAGNLVTNAENMFLVNGH